MALQLPENVPELGLYYHYKHDPAGPVNNYAYEFLGVIFHTEEDGVWLANYRPLYEDSGVYQASLSLGVPCVDGRPLEMWMGDVDIGGVKKKRFTRIIHEPTLDELHAIRARMYPRRK